MQPSSINSHRFRTPEELAASAASELQGLLHRRLPTVPFGIALSGGRIASKFYDAVVAALRPWPGSITNVHFFWADERCVPPDHPENNYATARRHLFDPLTIPPENIHRIRGEVDCAYAVQEAEAELCRLMPLNDSGQPVLNLIVLGMGEDGHVASLFPDEPDELVRSSAVYRRVRAVKPPPDRVTLGYAPIAAAKEVWMLVSGAGKKGIFEKIQEPDAIIPARRVISSRAQTSIFEDVTEGQN
jgi:6-phosphogluconolactonase